MNHDLLFMPCSATALWLAWLPIILFVLFMTVVYVRLRREGVTLRSIICEKKIITAYFKNMAKVSQNVIATPEPTPNPNPNPDPIHTPVQPPQTASTSRLIVFLTGITTLIIAVCLTSFWIYETGTGNTVIDFSKLTALFISLGIGIIPYGINQVSNAGSSSGGD